MKLKSKDIKGYRETLSEKQDNICPLCQKELNSPCLDHHHKSGKIRQVICRTCNLALGKIENLRRYRIPEQDICSFIRSCADYLEHHQVHPTDILHPTYRTQEEKNELRRKRAKRARTRRNAGIS